MKKCILGQGIFVVAMLSACANTPPATASDELRAGTGILVIAPDRGFMGNEETREAFAQVDYPLKSLVFITDERSRLYLDRELESMKTNGVRSLSVLPLFLSDRNPNWQRAHGWLTKGVCTRAMQCRFSQAFGRSYLAIDVLDEALQELPAPEQKHLVLVGFGPGDERAVAGMTEDWQRICDRTGPCRKFSSVTPVVWASQGDDEQQTERLRQLAAQDDTVLVSFHLGQKLDSMMSFDASLRRWMLRDIDVDLSLASPRSDATAVWLRRETNRSLMTGDGDIGVVVQAHGSDYHWNQTMREAVASLQSKYAVEFAFSMADRPSIEAALKRLEQRGMRGAVVVRVFGRRDSFRGTIEKMLGMDVESPASEQHEHHAGHGMGGGRIRTPLVVTTVGGLGSHPLFAAAMLARADELSAEPAKETVILVAHGVGDDRQNAAWIDTLEEVVARMRASGGDRFRAIEVATWREDWPDKREEWIARVRAMVTAAQTDGGRALVIPARTNSRGPEREFLDGLNYSLGQGFAPHPLFARWVESQAEAGIDELRANKL